MSQLLRKLLSGYVREATDGEGDDLGGEAVGTGNAARIALLNKIGEQSETEREGELADVNDDDTTTPFQAKVPGEETDEQRVEREAAEADAAAEAARLEAEKTGAPEKRKIKVNGKEVELTIDEIVARAQKNESADDYLREAARIRNELAAKVQPSKDVAPAAQVEEDDLALARAIQMGNEEEAVAAIRALRQPKGPSQDDLAKTIDERLNFNDAISKFRTEYVDIVSDPHLNKLALDRDAELIREGDKRPYYERYAEIGEELRGWMKGKTKTEEPIPVPAQKDKQARKQAAAPVPPTAGSKAPTTIEEETEESTSDIIANMAKARGGPQWMNGVGSR